MTRAGWKTRFGFYLAAVGSAFGLGNLWRFPYIVGENGGGAFVLLYVFLALVIGLPLLIGELILGKSKRRSVMMATTFLESKTPGKSPYRWIGRFSVLMSLVVLSYYAVISGWVLHFLVQFLIEMVSRFGFESEITMAPLVSNGFLQLGLASVHLIISIVIVLKGVQEGLEKWIGALMPAFVVMMVVLVTKTVSLPSTPEALRFLFYPDFSKLTAASLLSAIGHVCFTLSVGFGTMVTFGSYLSENEHIPTAAFRITLIDTLISLVAGVLIFPVALSFNSHQTVQDPGLLFESLPRFLLSLQGGAWFGALFFLCLYLASLSASIGLLEVIVSNTMDWKKTPRAKATWVSGGLVLLLSVAPAFSSDLVRLSGQLGSLAILDFVLIQLCLPLIAGALAFAVFHGLSEHDKRKHFIDDSLVESQSMYPYWIKALGYIVPITIGLAFVLQFADWLI